MLHAILKIGNAWTTNANLNAISKNVVYGSSPHYSKQGDVAAVAYKIAAGAFQRTKT